MVWVNCRCHCNCIAGVLVSVLASNVVDRGFEPDRVKPKTINWYLLLLR